MADHHWKKLSLDEIIKDVRLMWDEEQKAFEAGATFVLGVDSTCTGYCLRINYYPAGIYLCSDEVEFRQKSYSTVALITPHPALNGEIRAAAHKDLVDEKGKVRGKVWRDITIYVAPNVFEKFNEEAGLIYSQYSGSDLCFRGIPDIWFQDMELIRFIRDDLRKSSYLESWFSGRNSGTPYWLTPPRQV